MASNGTGSTKTVVVDLKLMPGDVVKTIQDLQGKIANLKTTMQGMKAAGLENSEQYIKLQGVMKDMQNTLRANQKVLVAEIQQQKSNGDSINALRGQLKSLRAEYEDLSKAERESAKGTDMLSHIQDLTKELKGMEEAQLDFSRNVGNYKSALEGLPFGKLVAGFNQLSLGTGKLSVALKNGKKVVASFAKEVWALMKIPIVGAIAVIVTVLSKLVNEIKKNDEAMTAMQRVMAAFKPILDIINKGFSVLVDLVAKAAGAIANFVTKIMSAIPGVKDYVAAEQDLVNATDALEEKEREHTVNSAKRQKEISDLRNKSVQSDKYTFEQRKKFLEDALKLEQQELQESKDIAAEKYRIAQEEALLEVGATEMTEEVYAKLADEVKNHLAELEAAVYQTETAFNDGTRRMQSQIASFTKQEENERKQAAQKAQQTRKERLKNEREALKALEDMYIKGIKDLQDQEIAQTKATYGQQIAAIKEKLETEKNLTKKAREAYNRQMVLLEADMQLKIAEIREKNERERYDKALQANKDYYQRILTNLSEEDAKVQIRLEINKIDTEQTVRALRAEVGQLQKIADAAQADFEGLDYNELVAKYSAVWEARGIVDGDAITKMRELTDQYNQEALEAQTRLENNINAVKKSGENEALRIQKESQDKQYSLAQKHAEVMAAISSTQELDAYRYNEQEKTRILQEQAERRLEIAREEQQRLADERAKYTDEQLAAMYGSVEEFNNAFAESELKVVQAEVAVGDALAEVAKANAAAKGRMIDTATAVMGAMNDVVGSIGDLFNTLADSDEKYEGFALAMAEMQILISTAISIAQAIQAAVTAGAATGVAAPLTTPVFIAEMVAIVVGAIASATTTLLKAKNKKETAPKFATGGEIKHGQSGVDKVPIMATKGEYIIKKEVVDDLGVDFFDTLNFGKKGKKLPKMMDGFHFASGGAVQVPNIQTAQITAQTFDYDTMREVMAEAVSEVQPVVSVKEITNTQNRVKTKERISQT